jgi:class 3 adenylate cyclase/tetratricopeptide (TPR) repeat protein
MTDRRLATVLFTDMVGSTQRAAHAGDQRWRELLERFQETVRRELRRFGGEEHGTAGDGFLATFDSPHRAILCAWALREAVRGLGVDVRTGIHVGEVERMGRDVGGIAVHTGARVGAAARGGEILVSSTVREAEAGSGFVFDDRGVHELKGIPGEWRLYAVSGAPLDAGPAPARSRARTAGLARVLGIYGVAAALVLALTWFIQTRFGLPPWTLPLAVGLLVIGLAMIVATASSQSRVRAPTSSGSDGAAPGPWDVDLKDVGRSVASGRMPQLTWGRSVLGGVVAFSLLFGIAGLYVIVKDRGQTFAPSEAVAEAAAPGIAVLPFSVRGPGLDVWREGMVDVLSTNLDGAAGLRAIDSRTVLARWQERVPGGSTPDLATMLSVAKETGARYAVVGNAVGAGESVRFGAEVYEVASGRRVGEGRVVSDPDSVVALTDRLSIEVLRAVAGGREGAIPAVSLARVATSSLPAMKAYLEGEHLYRSGRFAAAVSAFERAVEADSTFALAWSRLSEAYGWAESIESDLGEHAIERAARLADRLPAREAILVRGEMALLRGDMAGLEPLRQAVRRYPDDAEAWFLLGDLSHHLGPQALLGPDEAERAIARAVELDPGFAPYYLHLIDRAIHVGDARRAADLGERHARLDQDGIYTMANRLMYDLAFGDSMARERAFTAADTLSQERPYQVIAVGSSALWRPRLLETVERLLVGRPRLSPRIGYWIAAIQIVRGSPSSAAATITEPALAPGVVDRVPELAYLAALTAGSSSEPWVAEALAPGPPDTTATFADFYRGAWAAERGIWTDHSGSVAALHDDARRLQAAADSMGAAVSAGAARALDAYGSWRRGRPEDALQPLQAAQRAATGPGGPAARLNATIRWWLAELLIELERPAEAERYFRSLLDDNDLPYVVAGKRLGEVYERLGRPDDARAAYEEFLVGWQDADPELQPLVEEARAAVRRLSGGTAATPRPPAAATG